MRESDARELRQIHELVHLVREGVRPILAVSNNVEPIRKVLIAYSGSMESAKTMRQFIRTSYWDNIQLQIVSFGKANDPKVEKHLSEAVEYVRAGSHAGGGAA